MALTVSAVVHFASGDTSMAQLRLQESRAEWLGRGVVLLAVRDRALERQQPPPLLEQDAVETPDQAPGKEPDLSPLGDDNSASSVIFRRDYQMGGARVSVSLYPAAGLVSLNTAQADELMLVFQGLGGLDVDSAQMAVESIMAYRESSSPVSFDMLDNPGFRYVEELLAVPGMNRTAYDRLKPWVHVQASGSVNPALAPPVVSALFTEAGIEGDASAVTVNQGAAGALTFDSMYAQPRGTRGAAGDGQVLMAELMFVFDGTDRYRQMIQVDAEQQRLLRIDPVTRVPRGDEL